MVSICSFCGKWKRKDKFQWEFLFDKNKFGSFVEVDENVTYIELVEMSIEDLRHGCSVKSGDITLSYGLQPRMKSMVYNSPPVYIRNDRQVKAFFNRMKEDAELIPLCVTVNDKCNMIAVDNVDNNIQSKTIHNEENCDVEKTGRRHVLENLDVHSYVDESNVLEQQQQEELYGAPRSDDMSVNVTHNDACSTTENENHPFLLHPDPDRSPVSLECSHSTRATNGLYVNKYFKDKQDLMLQMRKWALEWNFEFKSRWSDKSRVILSCVDDKCSWRMRATKLVSSDSFVVKYVHDHTCDLTHRKGSYRQATVKLLGSLICRNYKEKKDGLKPKQIIEQVREEHGLQLEYQKAWRVKEHALNLIRGAPVSVTEVSSAPPTTRENSKRPSKKRMQSVGECGVPSSKSQKYKCSRCDKEGHNKRTCNVPL